MGGCTRAILLQCRNSWYVWGELSRYSLHYHTLTAEPFARYVFLIVVFKIQVCPVGASGVQHAMQIAAEVYHNLKTVITEEYGLAGMPEHTQILSLDKD